MKNYQIYNIAKKLTQTFKNDSNQNFPIKLSFKIHKNKQILESLAFDIEQALIALYSKYGYQENDNNIIIPTENIKIFQQEYNDLMEIEQEVNFLTVKIDELSDSIEISNQEMEAILFMIEE